MPKTNKESYEHYIAHMDDSKGCVGAFFGCLLVLAELAALGGLTWLVVWLIQHIH